MLRARIQAAPGLQSAAGAGTGSRMIWFNDKLPDGTTIDAMGADNMAGALGIRFDGVGDDWMRMRMPLGPATRQPHGRLHGGASVALAETVGSIAAGCTVDRAQSLAVGMEINANHIRPAYEGEVIATARPESIGRTTQVWSIRIEDEQGRLVCISRFTVAIIPASRK